MLSFVQSKDSSHDLPAGWGRRGESRQSLMNVVMAQHHRSDGIAWHSTTIMMMSKKLAWWQLGVGLPDGGNV